MLPPSPNDSDLFLRLCLPDVGGDAAASALRRNALWETCGRAALDQFSHSYPEQFVPHSANLTQHLRRSFGRRALGSISPFEEVLPELLPLILEMGTHGIGLREKADATLRSLRSGQTGDDGIPSPARTLRIAALVAMRCRLAFSSHLQMRIDGGVRERPGRNEKALGSRRSELDRKGHKWNEQLRG
jgi:hypothetical protein